MVMVIVMVIVMVMVMVMVMVIVTTAAHAPPFHLPPPTGSACCRCDM
jgi:hypothetical protein